MTPRAPQACGDCDMCKANVRYRCRVIERLRAESNLTVDVKCVKCGETFAVFAYLAAFVEDAHAAPMQCDGCRAGHAGANDYDRGYR